MTISELRDYLNGFAGESKYDNVEMVVTGSDHGYRRASAHVVDAEYCRGNLAEYFSDADMAPKSKKVQVLEVS